MASVFPLLVRSGHAGGGRFGHRHHLLPSSSAVRQRNAIRAAEW